MSRDRVMGRINRLIDYFLPSTVRGDVRQARYGRLIVAMCLLSVPVEPLFALRHFAMNNPVVGWLALSLTAIGIWVLWALRRGMSPMVAANVIAAQIYAVTFVMSLARGGFVLAPLVPNLLIPLAMALMERRRAAKIWCALIAVHFTALAAVTRYSSSGFERHSAFDYPQMIGYLGLATAIALLYDSSRTALQRENEALQQHIRSRERLEALGHLAAGLAHDFNNLLTVFKTSGEALAEALPPAHPLGAEAQAVVETAERGSAITRQLLAFSRPTAGATTTVDAGALISKLEPLLRRVVPDDIVLAVTWAPGCFIRADAGKVEHIVMNLITNARDAAIPGGRIQIEVQRDADTVVISVCDSGVGVAPEVLPHIFEPFFTTKPRGQGTGLGLSSAYGEMKATGGELRIASGAGPGTRFELVFPRADAPSEPVPLVDPVPVDRAEPAVSRGTILVVDDQVPVCRGARRVLAGAGYVVLEAHGGSAALELAREHQGTIDVLLTDVSMPHMGGAELAALLRDARPSIGVVYMSGYSEEPAVLREVAERRALFVDKPFERSTLLAKITEAMRARDELAAAAP